MKRLGRRDLLLFALPFFLLFVIVVRSGGQLSLDRNKKLFAEEIAHQIPVGMPWSQAHELLERNGFSNGEGTPLLDYSSRKPVPVNFFRSQIALPGLFARHTWTVVISVRDDQVFKVHGSYAYSHI